MSASSPPLGGGLLRPVAVVAVGGALGSAARYGVARAESGSAGAFPWPTLTVNLAGCLLIGVLVAVLDRRRGHRYARLFWGVGVLGGFTTFSTFALDLRHLLADGQALLAGGYLVASVAGGLLAVTLGSALGSWSRSAPEVPPGPAAGEPAGGPG